MGVAFAISPMSAPAANARSLPVTTIARTLSSLSSSSSATQSASMTAPLSALSCFGRFSRTSAVRWSGLRSTRTSCSSFCQRSLLDAANLSSLSRLDSLVMPIYPLTSRRRRIGEI